MYIQELYELVLIYHKADTVLLQKRQNLYFSPKIFGNLEYNPDYEESSVLTNMVLLNLEIVIEEAGQMEAMGR